VNPRSANGRLIATTFKIIDGHQHKLCSGPGHDTPAWLPATDKYFYSYKSGARKGKLQGRCRLCSNWEKLKSPGLSGLVPLERALPFFIEGINRVGFNEFVRRTKLSGNTVHQVMAGKRRFVIKRTMRAVMLEVISMRRKNEVRHRESIARGSYLHGEIEKKVTRRIHLYRPHGDNDTELRAQSRRRLTP
jgi:hypothetical protein